LTSSSETVEVQNAIVNLATRWFATLIIVGGLSLSSRSEAACPFCSAVSQTLAEEMAAMDTVAIARIVAGSETDSDAEFEVMAVIRGETLIRSQQKLRVNYFGKAKPDQDFLLMGVDPPDLLWSSPLPVSDVAINYVKSINNLPKEPLKRLEFYLDFLEHSDSMLARDAYDEFAKAPYGDIKSLKDRFDREQLIAWIKDTDLPTDRRRLYLVMLGVCGQPGDADLLEGMMKGGNDSMRAGLDAMIACYLTLKGGAGLPLVDELFLANKQSQYADTYSAIMALRFHGTDGGVIEKKRVLESMRLILDRPELADLVIPDLARWEDWTQIDKLAELFKSADEKSSWVRVPVINYLRACPLPEAEAKLEELKDIDPAAYRRAMSFFPKPKTSTESDSSSLLEPSAVRGLAVSDARQVALPGQQLASAQTIPAPARSAAEATVSIAWGVNRSYAIGVVCMVSVTIWLTMWLAISGAGRKSLLAYAVGQFQAVAIGDSPRNAV
jgi:hypothetical protein